MFNFLRIGIYMKILVILQLHLQNCCSKFRQWFFMRTLTDSVSWCAHECRCSNTDLIGQVTVWEEIYEIAKFWGSVIQRRLLFTEKLLKSASHLPKESDPSQQFVGDWCVDMWGWGHGGHSQCCILKLVSPGFCCLYCDFVELWSWVEHLWSPHFRLAQHPEASFFPTRWRHWRAQRGFLAWWSILLKSRGDAGETTISRIQINTLLRSHDRKHVQILTSWMSSEIWPKMVFAPGSAVTSAPLW